LMAAKISSAVANAATRILPSHLPSFTETPPLRTHRSSDGHIH
jgi:hypothetical protein